MISGLNIARVGKLVALFGFFLPWVLVSCSGQPIAHLTGLDLATGGVTARNPASGALQHQQGSPNLWIGLTLLLVLAGLVAGFIARGRQAIRILLAAAVVALIVSVIGIAGVGPTAQAEALHSGQPGAVDTSGLIHVDLQYGYFITVAGLLIAVGACGMVLAGRESVLTGGARLPPA